MTKNQKENQQQNQGREDYRQIIDCYLEVFRHMKYGVLEEVFEVDKTKNGGNRTIVVEAPCFKGDLDPVCKLAYFDISPETPAEMLNYYQKCEALVYQRFEQNQVWRIAETLGSLIYRIEFNVNFTKVFAVFDGRSRPIYQPVNYDLNALDLSRFVHDLLEYGKLRAEYFDNNASFGIYFSDIFQAVSEQIDLTTLDWEIVSQPWLLNAKDKLLTINVPKVQPNSHGRADISFTNDDEGAVAFIMRLFRDLKQQQPRDFMSNPNGTTASL